MICQHCNAMNSGSGAFCVNCGMRLTSEGANTVAMVAPPPPNMKSTPPPGAAASNAPASAPPAPQIGSKPLGSATKSQPVGQLGSTGTSIASIWGPFAGYGTRGRHVAWLLNDLHEKADTLRQATLDRFMRRQIPGARVLHEIFSRQGLIADKRPYVLVRRDCATAGLYIARFGKDLYISQVTYYKGPISNVRVLIVGLMAAFVLFYPGFYSGALDSVSADPFSGFSGLDTVIFLTCLFGPLYLMSYLALGLLAIFSFWKWLTEKDWLAAFRVPPNEFDVDDMVSLEKSVEQTVRESLDVIGVEQRLMPPAEEYGPRRRLI